MLGGVHLMFLRCVSVSQYSIMPIELLDICSLKRLSKYYKLRREYSKLLLFQM